MPHHKLKTVDGYKLSLEEFRAESDTVLIWMHGISVDKDEHLYFFREGAEVVARHGIRSLRFDFRGHGRSSGGSSEFTISGQNIDLHTVLRFAEKRFQPSGIHLVGASFGAPPAIFAAERFPTLVRSITLIAPVLSYRRTFLAPETPWAQDLFGPDKVAALYQSGRLYLDDKFFIGPQLMEEMWMIHPGEALRRVTQPTLVLHGDKDSMVPFDASFEVCKGQDQVQLISLTGADHGFIDQGDEEGTSEESKRNKKIIFEALAAHVNSS